MPIHRVPRATMHEDVRSIEREGERLLSATPDGDFVLLVTISMGDKFETRFVS